MSDLSRSEQKVRVLPCGACAEQAAPRPCVSATVAWESLALGRLAAGVRAGPGASGTGGPREGEMGATLGCLGARIGAPLRVALPTGYCLCTAWPRQDLADGYLQVDLSCRTAGVTARDLRGLTLSVGQLKLLPSRQLKKAAVRVVVKNSALKKSTPRAVLQELIRELLRNVYVSCNYVVTVAANLNSPVVYIEMLSVDILMDEAGLIAPQTSIKITEVVTSEWYRHSSGDPAKTSIAGLDDVGRSLKEMIDLPFRFPKTFKKLGLSVPNGVLLIGPFFWKTLTVKAVAKEAGAYLVCISGAALYGSRPGESEENLQRVFEKAREMSHEGPTILFIDEVDSLGPKRGSSNNAPEDRIVAQLLTLLDGVGSEGKMVIVAATDRPDALDPALRRPGRFDRE
ncbi:PREDICTED: spermatogenesis-associated protein 5-like protein 1, partial [Mesitornis unicolor]|uniref:spermatogenesis-associated protein 5-like protein 1 n=1 Tax=Mesitornis unicolor TaxID=54374 RepID=UPI0005283A01